MIALMAVICIFRACGNANHARRRLNIPFTFINLQKTYNNKHFLWLSSAYGNITIPGKWKQNIPTP